MYNNNEKKLTSLNKNIYTGRGLVQKEQTIFLMATEGVNAMGIAAIFLPNRAIMTANAIGITK